MLKTKIKICMIADGHHLYDDRLYWKEALSFQRAGYEINIIATGLYDEQGVTNEGISYHIVKIDRHFKNRFLNFIAQRFYHKTNQKILTLAKAVEADIYNFHDYQQLAIVKALRQLPQRPKIVYDARIPLFKNLFYLSPSRGLKKQLIRLYAGYMQRLEYRMARLIDVVITVDDGVYNGFKNNSHCNRLEVVYNYTSLSANRLLNPLEQRQYDAIHCGGITKVRGFDSLLKIGKLLAKEGKKLLLLGKIFEQDLIDELNLFIKNNGLQKHLIWIDHVRFDEVSDYYNNSKVGLNLLLPNPAHDDIIQIKLFEFMNFGIPIITSNFGQMKHYVEHNHVGITVNPTNEVEVVKVVNQLLHDANLYNKLSHNGLKAVDKQYNWSLMEQKLLSIYDSLYVEH